MPKPKNQKRMEAITRMQSQIDGWYNKIRSVKILASDPKAHLPSDEAQEMIAEAEDKIKKLQTTIRYTEMALQPSYASSVAREKEILAVLEVMDVQ